MKNNALTLFDYAGLALGTDAVGTVFVQEKKPILNKDGKQVGSVTITKLNKVSDARTNLQLKGKENNEEWLRTQQQARVYAFRRIKQHLNAMDENRLGLMRFSEKRAADGLLDMTMRIKEVPLKQSEYSIEDIMRGFECTREEAILRMAKAGLRPRSTEVESEVVPPPQISDGIAELQKEAEFTDKQAEQQPQQPPVEAPKGKGNKGSK